MDITGLEAGAYDFQLRVDGDDVSSTLGTYYTIDPETYVDKTALQALHNEVEDYTSSDNLYDDFVEAKEAAKVVLDDVSATQEEVDKAYDTLNNRYWRSRSNAYVAKYKDDVFPYTEYEAASTLPVVQVYTEARNHTVVSYPAEEYKKLVERFVEAEQQLKKLPENPRGVMAGPDEDMINTTEHRGIFTFSEYTDENGKQMLHIEYENNGINTITGESLGKFTKYNLERRLSVNIDRRNYDGSGYSSKSYTSYVKPLDGEKDRTKGFQLDIEVDPGMYSVRMTCNRKDTESYGFYYTLEDTTPPTAEVSYSNNGELTNQDVTVTIQADEAIQAVEGWTLSDDQTTLTKVFSENTDSSVTISDLAGNTAEVSYTVTGIDTTAPTAEVTYTTDGNTVIVRIQADEAIQAVEGWTLSDDQTTLAKVFSENTDGSVTISDLAGNTAEISYTVSGIDTTAPTAEVTYTKDGNTVIVTIQADEAIQPVEGWTLSDDQTTLTKVFSENTDGSVTISDLAGNTAEISYTVSGIDTTAPTAEVTYTKDGNTVIVTIQADEAIQPVEGWTLSDDQTTLTKVFSENTDGSVTISDLAGNTAEISYTVSGIDTTAPTAEVTYTKDGNTVIVTIQADEAIQPVEGWTLSDDQTTLTKVFSENTDGSVTISDLAGNTAVVNYTVSGIESDQPGEGVDDPNQDDENTPPKEEDGDNTASDQEDADTATVDSTGMFAMMLMISAGVVVLLQKRRKEE